MPLPNSHNSIEIIIIILLSTAEKPLATLDEVETKSEAEHTESDKWYYDMYFKLTQHYYHTSYYQCINPITYEV